MPLFFPACMVSILVLMDGVLRVSDPSGIICVSGVSILVLMDGVLRAVSLSSDFISAQLVSILVLMDGVLRGLTKFLLLLVEKGFNPCSNGWCTSSNCFGCAEKGDVLFQSLF